MILYRNNEGTESQVAGQPDAAKITGLEENLEKMGFEDLGLNSSKGIDYAPSHCWIGDFTGNVSPITTNGWAHVIYLKTPGNHFASQFAIDSEGHVWSRFKYMGNTSWGDWIAPTLNYIDEGSGDINTKLSNYPLKYNWTLTLTGAGTGEVVNVTGQHLLLIEHKACNSFYMETAYFTVTGKPLAYRTYPWWTGTWTAWTAA